MPLYWAFLMANSRLDAWFDTARSVGMADGLSRAFRSEVPTGRGQQLGYVLKELVAGGYLTRGEVEQAFPDLLALGR